MSTKFEKEVKRIWDNVMPNGEYDLWEKFTEENEARDLLQFATEIAREAFLAGVHMGADNPYVTVGEIMDEQNKRYPCPKVTKYRTSAPDSNGNRWQVRDGITWLSRDYAEFHPHIAVKEVIAAMCNLNKYGDAALLADIAANPTES